MLELNVKGVLPLDALTAEQMKPGPLSPACVALAGKRSISRIRDGFHLVFSSCFTMDDWKSYLRGKLPLGEMQPVQMCRSVPQVWEVMSKGLPKDGTDDALSEMDRLADML